MNTPKEIARLTIIVTETSEESVNIECLHEGEANDLFYKIGLLTNVLDQTRKEFNP